MEMKYFVSEEYRYRESGKWESKMSGAYDSLYEAKQAFHNRKAAITKATNDFAMVIVFDMYGNKVMADYDDTSVEPEPSEGE